MVSLKYCSRIFLASLFVFVLGGCSILQRSQLDAPDVRLIGLQLQHATLFEQSFAVKLRVSNPNNIPIPMAGFNYELQINDKRLAKGAHKQNVVLPPLGDEVLDVTISTSTLGWLRQVHSWQQQIPEVVAYSLSGKVFLEKGSGRGLKFKRNGEVDLNLAGRQPASTTPAMQAQ